MNHLEQLQAIFNQLPPHIGSVGEPHPEVTITQKLGDDFETTEPTGYSVLKLQRPDGNGRYSVRFFFDKNGRLEDYLVDDSVRLFRPESSVSLAIDTLESEPDSLDEELGI